MVSTQAPGPTPSAWFMSLATASASELLPVYRSSMASPAVAARTVHRWSAEGPDPHDDLVAVERPLEIRLDHGPEDDRKRTTAGFTMRTPGHDHDLALGFLVAEGVIGDRSDVVSVRHCRDAAGHPTPDAIRVVLADHVHLDARRLDRFGPQTSACGMCGRASIDHLMLAGSKAPVWTGGHLEPHVLTSLPERLGIGQTAFRHTGGIHAAGVFDRHGIPVLQREDVGRHNAVDKAVGRLWWDRRLPLQDHILVLSGRSSFELVQKAAKAGVPVVAAIGAPSSAACDLAHERGITLVGFLRTDRFNVYTHPDRIGRGTP